MSIAKTELFSEEQVAIARFARALGHPARIAIIFLLRGNVCLSCRQIVDALPLAQATVSQHLKALKMGGLIVGESRGTQICYSLATDRIREACRTFRESLEDV